jgi:pimeloyl-ACP methyl ester carboxylesterase
MKIFGWVTLGLCILLAALAAWLYTPDETVATLERKYGVGPENYATVAGIRLRFADTGPRDAPAVILLHGFGASLETWGPWTKALSPHYRVVSLDLPGFGLTGPDPENDYSDARALRILAGLMDRLGIARASIIGNSLGGRIAWNFAVFYPARVEKLVLISPDGFASPGFSNYDTKPSVPRILTLMRYILPKFVLRSSLKAAYADPKRLDDATLTRYWDFMRGPGDRAAMIARMRQTILPQPEPLLRRIAAPTLLLWGEQDGMIPFSNAQDYLKDIPNVQLVALPKLGHVPFEEAPAESLLPVAAFLARN